MGYTIWPDGPTGDVLSQVNSERYRQEQLCEAGKFAWTCAALNVSNAQKLAVLAEEFGEAAREVVEEGIAGNKGVDSSECRVRLRKELIQVAAVCVAWVESLKR